MKNKNKILTAKKVKELTMQHYESGRHDRCKERIFKSVVSKTYPMSRSTFFRYLACEEEVKENSNNNVRYKQLTLWNDETTIN